MTGAHFDARLRLVADHRRRRVIQHLRREANGETSIDALVDRLYEDSATDTDRRVDREQFTIQLYHVHLPKLAEHGVVEYDPERGTIQYRPDEQTEAVLDSLPDGVSVAKS